MEITPGVLEEFKERMHLEDNEDQNLMGILSKSNKALIKMCGNYDINVDEDFRELVFERSRYVYNDALEYFKDNFLAEINNLGIDKALKEEGDDDAAI